MGCCWPKTTESPQPSSCESVLSSPYGQSANRIKNCSISNNPVRQQLPHHFLIQAQHGYQSAQVLPASSRERSAGLASNHQLPSSSSGLRVAASVTQQGHVSRENYQHRRSAIRESHSRSPIGYQNGCQSNVTKFSTRTIYPKPFAAIEKSDKNKSVHEKSRSKDRKSYSSEKKIPHQSISHYQKNDRSVSGLPTRACKRKSRGARKKKSKRFSQSNKNSHQSDPLPSDCITPPVLNASDWSCVDFIHEQVGIDRDIVNIVVKMLKDNNTVPFMARYRRARTRDLNAERLRKIKEAYEKSETIKQEADNVIKTIEKVGICTPDIKTVVRSSKSLSSLKQILTLYQENRSSVEKARELGLDPLAQLIIQGGLYASELMRYLDDYESNEGYLPDERKVNEIRDGVTCIQADIIVKNELVLDMIQKLRMNTIVQIETDKIDITGDSTKATENSRENESAIEASKYINYYHYSKSEVMMKPHEVLAINRAEAKKIISVKLILPNHFEESLLKFVLRLFPLAAEKSINREFLISAFKLAFKESICPAFLKSVRSEITENAEDAAVENFAMNAKQLLLYPPVKGKVILGIDPGYEFGCKLAVISEQGDVLRTSRIFPHRNNEESRRKARKLISSIIKEYKCELIALGNGTGCRKTEAFIADLINSGAFAPLCVTYDIVDESGTSVYSCGPEAEAEFPDGLDCTLRSAVSIARRLQDPLAEYVKVDPKSLGIGMYQHDLPEHKLMSKWNEVIMEVVSFVGVDVNTASQCLLRRVAGLSDEKAANIIEFRKNNGPFLDRQTLRKVKDIDAKTFEQCAGFIRIMPEISGSSSLDQTSIHPDFYRLARDIIQACQLDLSGLGTREFISAVNVFASQELRVLAKQFQTNAKILEVIFEGLTARNDRDIRVVDNTPLFRKSLRSIEDLSIGDTLSGTVRNIARFGVFVDIGVEVNAFIYSGNIGGHILRIGQKLDVKIRELLRESNQIGLILIKAY